MRNYNQDQRKSNRKIAAFIIMIMIVIFLSGVVAGFSLENISWFGKYSNGIPMNNYDIARFVILLLSVGFATFYIGLFFGKIGARRE